MRLILQLCLLVLMLLGAEKRAWSKVATSPPAAVHGWGQDTRLGGGRDRDAPPRQLTSGEAAAWDADIASAGDIYLDDTLTMAGPVVVTFRGRAFLMCPGAPPPFIGSFRTTTPAWVAVGPNVYAYVMQNPWTAFDAHGLFKVESSAGMGLFTTPAVHETITAYSFCKFRTCSRAYPVCGGDGYSDFQRALKEGVRRPDTQGWSTESNGIPPGFAASYGAAKAGLIKGDMYDNHFGSKQWHHSMSSGDPAIKDAAALSNQIQSGLSAKFDSAITASAKGDWKTAGNLLGEICHTVQDSYSASHVGRDKEGRISNFNNYAMQDGGEHGKADTSPLVRRDKAHNLDAMKENIPGVTEACKATEGVFSAFFSAENPKEAFKSHMSNVFKVAPNAEINVHGGYKKPGSSRLLMGG